MMMRRRAVIPVNIMRINQSKFRAFVSSGKCGMLAYSWIWVVMLGCCALDGLAGEEKIFSESFDGREVGAFPEDYIILEGDWKVVPAPAAIEANSNVKEENENRCVMVPGDPLDQFGFLYGDYLDAGVASRGRVYATRKGRRFPSFGLGLHGVGGFQFRVSPSKRKVEILYNDEIVVSEPYRWNGSGKWTHLEVSLIHTKDDGRENDSESWVFQGYVWGEKEKKPKQAIIQFVTFEEPFGGESSVLGVPYSGTPIYFDDLEVVRFK